MFLESDLIANESRREIRGVRGRAAAWALTSWRRRAAREFSQRAKATMSATPAATPSARPSQNPSPLLRLLPYHRRPLRLPLRRPTSIWGQARKAKQPGGVGGRGDPGNANAGAGRGAGGAVQVGSATAAAAVGGRDQEFERRGKKRVENVERPGSGNRERGESETGQVSRLA
jgi:hypothetical protein